MTAPSGNRRRASVYSQITTVKTDSYYNVLQHRAPPKKERLPVGRRVFID